MQVRAPVPITAVLSGTFLTVTACGGGGAARGRAAHAGGPPPAVVQQLQVPEDAYRIIYTPPVNLASRRIPRPTDRSLGVSAPPSTPFIEGDVMTRRMASFSWPAVAAVVILAGARAAPAQQVVKLGEGETLTISGFINSTFFTDRGLFGGFGQGQNAEWAASAANQPTTDKLFTDADVRNTRIRFDFAAQPVLGKWAPKATLESDFFGTFT